MNEQSKEIGKKLKKTIIEGALNRVKEFCCNHPDCLKCPLYDSRCIGFHVNEWDTNAIAEAVASEEVDKK